MIRWIEREIIMKIIKLATVFIFSFTIAAFAGNAAATHTSKAKTDKRIKPAFSVYVAGDKVPQVANELPKPPKPAGPRSGEDVYNTFCTACHGSGVAGAPKLGDTAAWSARLTNGVDAVYANAINGLGDFMQPKGGCSDCSDDELKAVVDYMLEQNK